MFSQGGEAFVVAPVSRDDGLVSYALLGSDNVADDCFLDVDASEVDEYLQRGEYVWEQEKATVLDMCKAVALVTKGKLAVRPARDKPPAHGKRKCGRSRKHQRFI